MKSGYFDSSCDFKSCNRFSASLQQPDFVCLISVRLRTELLEAVPKDCLFKESRRRRINERGQEDEQLPRMAEHVSLIQRRSRDYSRFDFFREPSRCSSSVIFDILLHVARPSRFSIFSLGSFGNLI